MADEKKSGSFTPKPEPFVEVPREMVESTTPEPSDLDGMNLPDDEDGEDGEDPEL